MLKRTVDPNLVESGSKDLFRKAKRMCGALAALALIVCTLDLANVRPADLIDAGKIHIVIPLSERIESDFRWVALSFPSSANASSILNSDTTSSAPFSVASLTLNDETKITSTVSSLAATKLDLKDASINRAPATPSPAQLLHLNEKEYSRAERCLASAIYFESRGEPVIGQMAVAQVVINRVFSGYYPNDICSVVYQNADRYLGCQFTFACDGRPKVINEHDAWARAYRIAKDTLDGQIYVPEVGKSTHYHALYVHPDWTNEMKKLVRFGIHNFYRPIAWGNGIDEPVWGTATLNKDK